MKFKKFVYTSAAALTLFSAGAALVEAQNSTLVVQAATTKKKVMHNAYHYKKDGKTVVKTAKGKLKMTKSYHSVKVSKKVTIGGVKFYKISGKNEYIKARSIDGTKRKLIHDAVIYDKNHNKIGSKKLLKGAKVTTYGSPYTVKGKYIMYRIAPGQYIMKSNVIKKKASGKKENPKAINNDTIANNTSDSLLKEYQSWLDGDGGELIAIRDTTEYYEDGPATYDFLKGDSIELPSSKDKDYTARAIKDTDGKYYFELTNPSDGTVKIPAADFKLDAFKRTSVYKKLASKYISDKYDLAEVTLSGPTSDGSYGAGDRVVIHIPEIIDNKNGTYSLQAAEAGEFSEKGIEIPISSIASYHMFNDPDAADEE